MLIQSFDDVRATIVLTLNWGFDSQIQILGGSKNFIVYQVDMFRKEKIEKNTMQVF